MYIFNIYLFTKKEVNEHMPIVRYFSSVASVMDTMTTGVLTQPNNQMVSTVD